MVPSPSTDPDETSGHLRAFLLNKGTPRELFDKFHVSSRAGMMWEYINPSTTRAPAPIYPIVKGFDSNASSKLNLNPEADAKFQKALKVFDRQQTLFITQEKALAEVSAFLNQSVHPDHHWVYWKKATLRGRLLALKNEFKPSNNARIYEVDARYKEALKTNRIQMDAWLSKYWRAYTEAEELQIPAVAGFHGHLNFLKAVNTFSPDFSVTQTATVKEAMFDGKDATELPSVQKLVKRFRNHMRLRKAQGVTAEQLSRGTFGITLNGKTPSQTGPSQNTSDNSSRNNNQNDPKVRKKVDKRIANGTDALRTAVRRTKKESKPQTPQSASALFVKGLPSPTDPQANSVTTGYSLKRSTLLDPYSDFHVDNRKADFIDLHPPTVGGRLLAGGKYLDILGEGTRKIALTTPDGRTNAFFPKNCLYVPEMDTNLASHRLFQQVEIYWNYETDVVYHKESRTSRTEMAKIRWIERQLVIHYVEPDGLVPEDESDPEDEVILESEDEDFVTEPLVEKFLPLKLKKLHGNDPRGLLKPLERDATLWHRRLAHLGPRALEKVVQAVTGAKIQLPSKIDCQDCVIRKARNKVSRRPQTRERKPFVTIYANLFEFNDAFDGRTKALIITLVFLERQQHIKVKTIVSDGETSFGRRFRRWLLDTGISHETSPPYTKEPAGVQERAGGVIITKARCLMISSNLPSDLWPEAVEAATYITNRTPTKALGWKTPIQVLNEWIAKRDKTPIPEEGLKANVANVVLFGSEAYALTEAVRRGADRLKKMDPRAYIGYLVGYVASNVYRVWVPSQQRVITVRDVTFDETKKYRDDQPQKSSIEIAELNDQIDSILIPPKATTFLGTSRAVFSSDPLDTVATDPPDQDASQEARGWTLTKTVIRKKILLIQLLAITPKTTPIIPKAKRVIREAKTLRRVCPHQRLLQASKRQVINNTH
ncbi:hypothetical protein DL764_009848 [Monosporascus ibericus]|uniref:Integrase catalytic domain-containing protein n=1 Tax=Monosporascus ibericus TaxID=155417 RepID=A0A4Q4STZ8_9PEZI|nr:hypothetical protein DL764_009848 [Monosporascus ibericus]